MRDIRAAFQEFWGGFINRSGVADMPLKAFQSGYAVEQPGNRTPELPYITYTLSRPEFADFTILTGTIWDRRATFGLVDDVLAQAAEKIPTGGITVDLGDNGMFVFYRSTPFTQYLPPENEDPLNKAGLISIIVQSYVI